MGIKWSLYTILVVILKCFVKRGSSTCNFYEIAEINTSFSDSLITDLSLWVRTQTGSVSGCVSDCVRDYRCVSVFFNTDKDTCTGHAVQFYSTEPSLVDTGSLYYTLDIDVRDCADIKINDPSSNDGVYTINPPDGLGPIRVYCDMTTDGGGWVVFQRREDGSVDFYREWRDYKTGFGDMEGEFWLGNDIISRLTNAQPTCLRIDLRDINDYGYATYSNFLVAKETSNYKLSVSGYAGNVGDSLTSFHNGMVFSTKDRDNDLWGQHCAQQRGGGWWYKDCHSCNLNGFYGNNVYSDGINWESWRGFHYSIGWTEMKLKRS